MSRTKDYDISELIEICSKPKTFDERVACLKSFGDKYPELKYFMIVAYFCKDSFTDLCKTGEIEYRPSKIHKGSSVENLRSMWTVITRLYNAFPSGPKIKRGLAYQLLCDLHPDDAAVVYDLLFGRFYRKELNEKVVQAAFPELVPSNTDPKF